MTAIYLVLLILGLVCFVVDALGVKQLRVDLLSLGLAFWITVPLLHQINAL